ncbi:MAG: UDP-3-O-(3-hydroxymyristoyl)glucosamine N-acyltransferase [Fidelibacterota bacterium]
MASLQELADLAGGKVIGNPKLEINGVSEIQNGKSGTISFLSNPKYKKYVKGTAASAIITSDENTLSNFNGLLVDNPQLVFAKILEYFQEKPTITWGIHPSATISDYTGLAEQISIGPNCVIEEGVKIGDKTIIGANTVLSRNVVVGRNCNLHSNIHIYHSCIIGDNCNIFSGTVIGSDGFGYVESDGIHHKTPQTGSVKISDHVDVGANCTIDRGTIGNTFIGPGSKFDNLVHIAHNVKTGCGCLFAAGVAIAGSVEIGDFCIFAGHSGVIPHVKIGNRAVFAIKSVATKSLPGGKIYAGMPAREIREQNKKDAIFSEIDSLKKRIARIENAD